MLSNRAFRFGSVNCAGRVRVGHAGLLWFHSQSVYR